MKTNRIALLVITMFLVIATCALACESEQYLDGYKWTFHRMDDGNKFHEVRNLGEFTEGNTLNLTAPCMGRVIETVQVEWEDDHSEVFGELVVRPGNKRLGRRDISGKNRVSWSVNSKVNRILIEFSGKRGHRARVKFIRVFYGKNSMNKIQQQGQGAANYKLVDLIKINNAQVMRKARVIKWDGTRLHVAVKTPNGKKVRTLLPAEITNLAIADRWGKAVAKDGSRFPVRIKNMSGAMMNYEKKLNGNVVPKPLTNIHNFTSIVFN